MKTKILLLALAIMATSLVYAQTSNQETKTNCSKKVLKKIQRKMNSVNFDEFIEVGQKRQVIVTCELNTENIVEVVNIEGGDEQLNEAITKSLLRHPVKCDSPTSREPFTFLVTFKMISG